MKRIKCLLAVTAGVMATIMLAAPALAAGPESGATGAETAESETQAAIPYPTDIQLIQQGERNYLHKTFTVAADYGPDSLVEPVFSQGGYRYRFSEIIQRESTPASTTKTVTESKTVDSETDDKAALLDLLGDKLPYSDEEGFEGELFVLPETLAVTETGQTTYTYTVSDTRRLEGLASNDMANIPKSIVKSGLTLQLQTVDWQVTGGEGMGYSEVPTSYTAVAYYSAPTIGTKAAGYTATAAFSGEVLKELVGKSIYTIVYEGEQIIIPFNFVPFIIAGVIVAGCLITCVILWRLRKNVEVYVYQAGVPELHTKLRVSLKKPIIELRQLSDVEIRLMFDRHFSKRLLDQKIFVISKYRNTRFDLNGMRVVDLWLPGDKEKKEDAQ